VSSDCSLGYGDGSQQRAPDMVFLRDEGAEQHHETVAGKLRCGAPIAMHLSKAGRQKRADEVAHRLGPEPFGEGVDPTRLQNSTATCSISLGSALPSLAVGLGTNGPRATAF
jgi:hypothetical protein